MGATVRGGVGRSNCDREGTCAQFGDREQFEAPGRQSASTNRIFRAAHNREALRTIFSPCGELRSLRRKHCAKTPQRFHAEHWLRP
jgi:hypothetical protein